MKDILLDTMRAGVKFDLDGDELRISAPIGVMNDALRQKLRDHKADIVQLLRAANQMPVPNELPSLEHDMQHRHAPFPLTDVQHAYWMGRKNLLELGKVSTHFYFELDCPPLDIPRLNEALRMLIKRHEMLRAVVDEDGMQRIFPSVPQFQIKVYNLDALSPEESEQAILKLRERMSHEVLPSDQWPLFDVQATSLSSCQRMRLHISLDMLILDAWSMFILFKEWFQLYQSPDTVLPPITLSYRDYIIAERKMIGGAAYQRARNYWINRIDTLPPAPELPILAAIPNAAPRFSRRRTHVERADWSKLKDRARTEGLTVSGLLLAAYAEILARWSSTPYFTLNLTLFNRLPLHPQVSQLIGDFTSLVMLEVDHRKGGTNFIERAKCLQRQLMDDLEHREFSGVEVLREWARRRNTHMQAMMPVVFTSALVLGGGNNEDAGLVEKFGPMIYGVSQTPQVWLDNQVMEIHGNLVFNWDAVDAMFEDGVLDAMFCAYEALLKQLADDDTFWTRRSVVALPAVMEACRLSSNFTNMTHEERLLHAGFLHWAKQSPHAPAIITSTRTLSYHQLLAESVALANKLRASGVQPGELVAVLMHKGWEQIVAVLGTLIAGAAYLPVDANLPRKRQGDLLTIGEVIHVITQPDILHENERTAFHDSYTVHEITPAAESKDKISIPPTAQSLDDLAYVIFTSGTTGTPKGVMITHRGAINTVEHINRMFQIAAGDRILAVSSLSFDLSVYDIFGLLGAGGALVIPEHGKHLDPVYWKDAITLHGITLWNSAPQLMRMLMDAFGAQESGSSKLRVVLLSGDWVPLDLPARVTTHYPNARVTSLGGATEASIWSIYYPVEAIDLRWTSIPYGKPLPNQTIWVLDHQMRPCPDHVAGRIFIGGIGLAKGYWRDEEKTAQRFIAHPSTSERLYDTGDLGRYAPDGNVIFLGRNDDQVKIRGHRVELGEIAEVLRQHPDVKEAAVLATKFSREKRGLVAYIELQSTNLTELGDILHPTTGSLRFSSQPLQKMLSEVLVAPGARMLDEAFRQTLDHLEDFYLAAQLNALKHFGIQGTAGERIALDRILAQGVANRYSRWLQRAAQVLVEDGYACEIGNGVIEVIRPWKTPDMAGLSAVISARLQADLDFTHDEAEWFTTAVKNLPDILTDKIHSEEIYAPETTAQIYQKLFPGSHAQLARVIEEIARVRQGGLKVLEVGAGIGSATQHLLPVLSRENCHYVYTDISEYFLSHAHGIFSSQTQAIEFGLLDMDIRPEFQGYQLHDYDLVIASSMLHGARNIDLALSNLLSLLQPGGQLVLLEETRFFRSFDLHIGLQQGFDIFEDEHLRPHHCLLSKENWENALRQAGFTDVAIVDAPGTVIDHLGFHVIVATAPLAVPYLNHPAVADYLFARLPEYMVPPHLIQLKRMPVSANGKIDYKSLPDLPENLISGHGEKVEPRNETEKIIQDAWRRIMQGREIGVTDNFFELGGDSLVATQLVREINQSLSFNLEMHEFFENLSIETLANLYLARSEAATANVPAERAELVREIKQVFPALQVDGQKILQDIDKINERISALDLNITQTPKDATGTVLLTGATGWLGAYLLVELLETSNKDIYCLVRANDEATALARILDNLQRYKLMVNSDNQRRIKALPGDLAKPRMDLDDQTWHLLESTVDAIFHFAASVSILADYDELFRVNVLPIEGLVQLALSGRRKSLFYGSSAAVSIRHIEGTLHVIREESASPSPEGLLLGYAQSKWATEQIILSATQKGMPAKIFRLSHVLPAAKDMACKSNYIFESVLQLARSVPVIPDWEDSGMYGIPIDKLVRLIVEVAMEKDGFDGIVHIENHDPIDMKSLVQLLHEEDQVFNAPVMPLQEWMQLCFLHGRKKTEENAILIQRLFQPTPAGCLVELLFGKNRGDTDYFDQRPGGKEKLTGLTPVDYWRRYARSTTFIQ